MSLIERGGNATSATAAERVHLQNNAVRSAVEQTSRGVATGELQGKAFYQVIHDWQKFENWCLTCLPKSDFTTNKVIRWYRGDADVALSVDESDALGPILLAYVTYMTNPRGSTLGSGPDAIENCLGNKFPTLKKFKTAVRSVFTSGDDTPFETYSLLASKYKSLKNNYFVENPAQPFNLALFFTAIRTSIRDLCGWTDSEALQVVNRVELLEFIFAFD
ncbi:MAG: hypothetical protein ACPG4S_05360 [Schleiferiaceae bacterium]